jgi:UDP-N-acetylmuramate dehydrogenase
MMFHQNFNLKKYHTFGIDAVAKQYVECNSDDDVRQLITDGIFEQPFFILAGGSNVVFEPNFDGTVVHPAMKGINIVQKEDTSVLVECEAGVEWDALVAYCVDNEFYGVENLSYIPGNVGASPVQNIGAYGIEAKDVIEYVIAIDLKSGQPIKLLKAECHFGYRDSIFKRDLKGKVMIVRVGFRLSLVPAFHLDYGQIQDELSQKGTITLKTVRETIIDIRRSKLPDPEEKGNAGSFFKNPVVSADKANRLMTLYPKMPFYQLEDGSVKIPAGWLIETSGWKGRSLGPAAVHEKQALVIVNLGSATGLDIDKIAQAIENDVLNRFDIALEREVNFVK